MLTPSLHLLSRPARLHAQHMPPGFALAAAAPSLISQVSHACMHRLFVPACIHLSIQSCIKLFIFFLVRSFVRSFIHSSILSSILSFIHSFMHSCIRTRSQQPLCNCKQLFPVLSEASCDHCKSGVCYLSVLTMVMCVCVSCRMAAWWCQLTWMHSMAWLVTSTLIWA